MRKRRCRHEQDVRAEYVCRCAIMLGALSFPGHQCPAGTYMRIRFPCRAIQRLHRTAGADMHPAA